MSKKKKQWDLPEDPMDSAINLMDALMNNQDKSEPVDISAVIGDEGSYETNAAMDALGARMAKKQKERHQVNHAPQKPINPIRDFIDNDRIDETIGDEVDDNDTEVDYDEDVPVLNEILEEHNDDTSEEDYVADGDVHPQKVVGVRITDDPIPGRMTIYDGQVYMPFSFDYPLNVDVEITIETICETIRSPYGLDEKDTDDIVSSIASIMQILSTCLTITRHPVAILTEQEFCDYFGSLESLDINVFPIINVGDLYCVIYFPEEEKNRLYQMADQYVDEVSSNSPIELVDSNERIVNSIRFFVSLAKSAMTINNKCAYDEEVYIKAIKENCNLMRPRDIAELVAAHEGTKNVDIREIMQRNNIDDICARLGVIDNYTGLIVGVITLIDLLCGNGDEYDDEDEEDDESFSEEVAEEIEKVQDDINSVLDLQTDINAGDEDDNLFDEKYIVNSESPATDINATEETIASDEQQFNPLSQDSKNTDSDDGDDSLIIPARRRNQN